MKYYSIKGRNTSGYLSETLCRVNDNGIFEIYDWMSNKASGDWTPSEKYKKIFDEKNELYEIKEPTKKEIDALIMEADDAAYDDYHTSYHTTVDSNGTEHTDYIYQDYRSIDGKPVEHDN